MKYLMTVVIADPNTAAGMSSDVLYKIECIFTYDPEQYGNGYWLRMKKRGPEGFVNHVDLRYDKNFDRNDKLAYLERWAKNYWSGQNGAYCLKSIRFEKL